MENKALLDPVLEIARKAGERILEVYHRSARPDVEIKADQSPRTEADLASQETIVEGLAALTPDIPVLGEETADEVLFSERSQWSRFWLVDPLDGTKEFLERTDQFCVNIALIDGHQPVLGVIYVPVTGVAYLASKGEGAFKQAGPQGDRKGIQTRPSMQEQQSPLKVLASRLHSDTHLKGLFADPESIEIDTFGSAIKFGLIAEGVADIYPRLGPTSEWDTGAGQCIVEEAGGAVVDLQLNPLHYNTQTSLLNPSFLVVSDPNRDWRGILKLGDVRHL